ncbi:hypothetical protein [Streptomyces sp. LN704]|uniref:hypothetical protein n=1 Tax=Streptomyces sp. LN704 TaxID=3112982 RepID=UPI003721C4FD
MSIIDPALAARVAETGVPLSADLAEPKVRTLDQVEDELTGVSLSLYEEELETARLRLALKSAQRGRRELRELLDSPPSPDEIDSRVRAFEERERLRARVAELETQRKADHETWQHDLETARSEREATAARIAELESERHVTNEALDDAVQALRAKQEEPAPMYVSRLLPPRDAVCARPGCGHLGEDHHHGDTKCWANLPRTRQRNGTWSAVPVCFCEGFVAGPVAEGVSPLVPREDLHDSPLAHRYLVGRDLPPLGGA